MAHQPDSAVASRHSQPSLLEHQQYDAQAPKRPTAKPAEEQKAQRVFCCWSSMPVPMRRDYTNLAAVELTARTYKMHRGYIDQDRWRAVKVCTQRPLFKKTFKKMFEICHYLDQSHFMAHQLHSLLGLCAGGPMVALSPVMIVMASVIASLFTIKVTTDPEFRRQAVSCLFASLVFGQPVEASMPPSVEIFQTPRIVASEIMSEDIHSKHEDMKGNCLSPHLISGSKVAYFDVPSLPANDPARPQPTMSVSVNAVRVRYRLD